MSERGFTLIEVLVALALTALVAMMAYASLSSVIAASESTRADAAQLQSLDRLLAILERDINLVVARPAANEYGEIQPALRGGVVEGELLLLTRAGWPNSREQARSDLQRVRYRASGGKLWRDYWVQTDPAPGIQPISTSLASDLEDIRLRFLGPGANSVSAQGSEWRESWQATAGSDRLPVAVEVVLEVKSWGEIRRLMVLPGNV
jgi:general secretion pathway protein J